MRVDREDRPLLWVDNGRYRFNLMNRLCDPLLPLVRDWFAQCFGVDTCLAVEDEQGFFINFQLNLNRNDNLMPTVQYTTVIQFLNALCIRGPNHRLGPLWFLVEKCYCVNAPNSSAICCIRSAACATASAGAAPCVMICAIISSKIACAAIASK